MKHACFGKFEFEFDNIVLMLYSYGSSLNWSDSGASHCILLIYGEKQCNI